MLFTLNNNMINDLSQSTFTIDKIMLLCKGKQINIWK